MPTNRLSDEGITIGFQDETGQPLRENDGSRVRVHFTAVQWTRYKRLARREHMKIRDWLELAIEEGLKRMVTDLA